MKKERREERNKKRRKRRDLKRSRRSRRPRKREKDADNQGGGRRRRWSRKDLPYYFVSGKRFSGGLYSNGMY